MRSLSPEISRCRSPSLQQSPAERVLDLLFVSRLSSLTVGAFTYLRTILTGRPFMSHCQAATHEGGGLETYDRVVQAALAKGTELWKLSPDLKVLLSGSTLPSSVRVSQLALPEGRRVPSGPGSMFNRRPSCRLALTWT